MFPIRLIAQRFCIALACVILTPVWPNTCFAQFIVAHRGASYDAPENTLAAFRLAWEQGADAIEGDFYLTADGQIVCIHDKTTKRVAPGQPELTVAKSTLQELRQLDVGRWKADKFAEERIPTLKEVLAIVPRQKRIFVEIKCGPEIVPILQQQLSDSDLKPEQIVMTRGADEAIVLLSNLFCEPHKDSIITCPPTDPAPAICQHEKAPVARRSASRHSGKAVQSRALPLRGRSAISRPSPLPQNGPVPANSRLISPATSNRLLALGVSSICAANHCQSAKGSARPVNAAANPVG